MFIGCDGFKVNYCPEWTLFAKEGLELKETWKR